MRKITYGIAGILFNHTASLLLVSLRAIDLASADPGRKRLHVSNCLELCGQEIVGQHREVRTLAGLDRAMLNGSRPTNRRCPVRQRVDGGYARLRAVGLRVVWSNDQERLRMVIVHLPTLALGAGACRSHESFLPVERDGSTANFKSCQGQA